jgi:hypothetical protein
MNRQEIFDTVARHLLSQGKKCEIPTTPHEDGVCMYRYNGMACAVGVLIPDDLYNESMEGYTISVLIGTHLPRRHRRYTFPDWICDNIDFIVELQRVHDWEEPRDWVSKLEELARNNNLVWTLDSKSLCH